MKTSFLKRQDLTDNIASFSFQKPDGFTYTAGQYIELSLLGHVEHGATAWRWFTLSSSPHESELTITTRIGTAAHTAFKRALENLEPGAAVDISDAMGDFVLPKLLQTPVICIAGGMGITPFRSQLAWISESGEQRPLQLLYGVRTEDDILFQEVFERAGQHATIVVEEPSAAWGGERGRLNAELILGLAETSADTFYYISGPENFVVDLGRQLERAGVKRAKIVHDEFQGYNRI